jgi:hypothetical protein
MAVKLGTFFVDVKGVGGHAIGFRNDTAMGKRVFDFFDPNHGLFRTDDIDDFQADVRGFLSVPFFQNLRVKMRFFKVKRS